MADGGGDRQAMITSTPILWGEVPGLSEAYIPLDNRPRSRQLLGEANSLMGNPLGVGQQQVHVTAYITNPWTGEELLTQARVVAQEIANRPAEMAAAGRKKRYF